MGSPVDVEIRSADSKRDREVFIRFPWRVYPGAFGAWVPPLLSEERRRLDPRNPFFEHACVRLFLAHRGNDVCGRIAAIENTRHNEFHRDKVGFFGLFESVDDVEVAEALLDAASRWLLGRDLDRIRGPVNLSTNDDCGLLVDNFDDPPCVMMPFNPPYYETLLRACGLERIKDLLAYRITRGEFDEKRFSDLGRLIARSGFDIRVRPLRMRDFRGEVALIQELYNSAWEHNWGFVPMTDAEIEDMAARLKPIIQPELALIGRVDDQYAGFALALPDLNQALCHANGRLFPFGLVKILWHKRLIRRMRIITLGIKEQFRRTGLASLFYKEIFDRGVRLGYTVAESSWVLEDNHIMNSALEKMGFQRYKTYRLYERPLLAPEQHPVSS